MPPKTVIVPEAMEELFAKAESVVSSYFSKRRDQPEVGTIEIFEDRYVLVRGAALSVEFFTLVEELFGEDRQDEARDFARNILFDLAHAIGKSDAAEFHEKMGLTEPIERLSAGPVHFAFTGWAKVEISDESVTGDAEAYKLVYDHPYSFESDAWMKSGKVADFPVCIMNAGYSSGWCQVSFGLPLVASEILCKAQGDDCCRFVMAHPDYIEDKLTETRLSHGLRAPTGHQQIPDFFARKRLQDELRRAHDELEERVRARTKELQEAKEALEREIEVRARLEQHLRHTQKLEALGGLAGGIAHDFNNILTSITGYAEVARLVSTPPRVQLALDEILKATQRATRLTRQLLIFSRQEMSERQPLDLTHVVSSMANMLDPLLGEKVSLILQLPDEPQGIYADPSHIEQILVNLVVNARDAMPDGGEITVSVRSLDLDDAVEARSLGVKAGRKVVLAVDDNGVGMNEDIQRRMFEPFYTTKESGKGTGLGLAIVYGVAQKNSAGIRVESRPSDGSRFEILFEAHSEEVEAPPSPPAPKLPRSRPLILVVEDEPSLQQLMELVLSEAGIEPLIAMDAEEALLIVETLSAPLDGLLTDVMMPGMSGPALAAKLLDRFPDLKVLFMSGYAADTLQQHGLDHRAPNFLQKPFTIEQLTQRLWALFDA